MAKSKINRVFIIGTIQEVDIDPRKTSDGRDYLSGKIVVKTKINDIENLIDVKLFTFALKKDGTSNPVYNSYLKLDGYKGKRVKISGDLRDGAMVDQTKGGVRHFNEIYLGFINSAKDDELDTATFEYSGFVVKELYERKNKDDETIGYRIDVGQANWNDTNAVILRFDVNKNDLNIANAIESNYTVGSTIKFSGILSMITSIETKTEEVAFGEPIVKQFTKVDKTYRITGGEAPLDEDNPQTYTAQEIKDLIAAYKEADAKRIEDASNGAAEASAPASTTGKAMSNITRSSSLL